MLICQVEFKIGMIKIMHMSGTSSMVIGKALYEKQSSHSKTNNGVGSAYGDKADIDMSPEELRIYDGDIQDNPVDKDEVTYRFCDQKELFKE